MGKAGAWNCTPAFFITLSSADGLESPFDYGGLDLQDVS